MNQPLLEIRAVAHRVWRQVQAIKSLSAADRNLLLLAMKDIMGTVDREAAKAAPVKPKLNEIRKPLRKAALAAPTMPAVGAADLSDLGLGDQH